jgi:hypothetical protein
MARPLHYERFYREVVQTMRELVPGTQINLSINEWGMDLPCRMQIEIVRSRNE